MKINELEQQTGLDRPTIRYYENEGMIHPERQENGYRNYSQEDQEQLLKIKLLRQLGLPLAKIREIQEGYSDFRAALDEQIQLLEAKRDTAQRSTQICEQMRSDGVTYATMNAKYYLDQLQLTRPEYPQNAPSSSKLPSTFRESFAREYHPFRHLFARLLDMVILTALIMFVQVLIFRARSDMFVLPQFLLLLLWIPLEALCYALFAATPGKLAFGIRVHHADGCKHTFRSAVSRAFGVYRYGLGWGIPFLNLWRYYKSYKIYADNEELEWNYESEITYRDFGTWKEKCKPVIVTILLAAMIISTIHISDLPKYRGNNLNVEQFSSNFNDYWNRIGNDKSLGLNADGTFKEKNQGQNVVHIGSSMTFDNFKYTLDNNRVKAVEYEEFHDDVGVVFVLPDRCAVAAIALLGAQEGETIKSLQEFVENLNQQVESALLAGINELELDYGSIQVFWKIEYTNCELGTISDSTLVSGTDDGAGTVHIQFRVALTEQ